MAVRTAPVPASPVAGIPENARLGVLYLERGSTTSPASAPHPETFYGIPVIAETVSGAWVENVVRGDPTLEPAYIAAAQRLVERGAVAIASDCGFSIRHQAAVSASVDVPVAMSSLLLLPTLLRQLPPAAKIAVLTYDSAHCDEDLFAIDDPAERDRIVIGGLEGGVYWHNELKDPVVPTDPATLGKEVASCLATLRDANPEIAAVLFECAGFPAVAPGIRRIAKLPVFDITSLCRMNLASVEVNVP